MHSNLSNRSKTINVYNVYSLENKQHLLEIVKKRKLNTKTLNENWEIDNIYKNNELSDSISV